jgi:BASS family bile acid:Na+ symporter
MLLAVPMSAAMITTTRSPEFAARIRKPLARFSAVALASFILFAASSQFGVFVADLGRTLPIVMLHNGLGLALGWIASRAAKLQPADLRAVVIEGGMQNSGLALGIIAAQFNSDLAMVAVAGLWGVWHIVSGGTLALLWRRRDRAGRARSAAAA